VIIGKLKKPLTCPHTHENISFVFLVLSPKAQPRNHLNALSEISTFIMKEENRHQMQAATSREELIELFFPELADD